MTRRRSGHARSRSRQGSGLSYPTFPSRTRALLERIHLRRPKRARAIDEHRVAKPAKTPEQWRHAPNRSDVKGVDLPTSREIHAHRTKIARATDEAKNAPTAKTPYQWMERPERTDLKGIDKPKHTPRQNPYRLTPEQRKKMVTLINESQWTDPRIWSLQDGFGRVGYTPEDGHHDWSAIRDSSDQAVRAMYRAARQMPRKASAGRKRKPTKHHETHEPQGKRIYPEVKNVSTLEDARRLITLIENDNIPKDLKRQRLQFMYALCYAKDFEKQFKESITEARDLFHSAYTKYTKKEKAIGEGKPKPSPKAGKPPKDWTYSCSAPASDTAKIEEYVQHFKRQGLEATTRTVGDFTHVYYRTPSHERVTSFKYEGRYGNICARFFKSKQTGWQIAYYRLHRNQIPGKQPFYWMELFALEPYRKSKDDKDYNLHFGDMKEHEIPDKLSHWVKRTIKEPLASRIARLIAQDMKPYTKPIIADETHWKPTEQAKPPSTPHRTKEKVTEITHKPTPKVNLAELYKRYEPPDWVKDKAKYRDMWRHYVSECRKSGVGEDRYDFDQELYDDEISRDAIKEKIHKHVWGLAPESRAQDEYLAQKYEEIVGVPRSEYEAMKMKLEQAEEATA